MALVALFAAAIAFGLAKLPHGEGPGTLIYASKEGVFIHELASGKERRAVTLPKDTVIAIPSPDGKWVGYAEDQGQVSLVELKTGRHFQIADSATVPVAWTPDNKLVCEELLSDGDLVAVSPDAGRDILMTGGYVRGTLPVFIDKNTFAIASSSTSFVLVHKGHPGSALTGTPLAASPDGAQLSYQDGHTVNVAKVKDGAVTGGTVIFNGDAVRAAGSAQGFLAMAGADRAKHSGLFVFEGGTKTRRLDTGSVTDLAWSANATAIVYERDGVLLARELKRAHTARVSTRGRHVFAVDSFVVVP